MEPLPEGGGALPHVSQTDVTMFLDGVQVRDGRMPEPYWYAGHTLKICVDGIVFQLGTAKGDDHNCLIDTLRQMLNERHGALIVQGSVADVRARLEDRHRGGATPIASLDFLDLADHWEDIVDLLEGADEGRSVRPLGSARYEVMCVDLMYVGSGDRLPRRRDRGGRKTLYIARVNGNHFVPLKWVANPRSLRPEPPAPHPWGGAPAAAPTVHELDLPPAASASAAAAPAASPGATQAGSGSAAADGALDAAPAASASAVAPRAGTASAASQMAADAAAQRLRAEKARGLGPDAAARLEDASRSRPASGAGGGPECFGVGRRDQLRRALDKSRAASGAATWSGATAAEPPGEAAAPQATPPGPRPPPPRTMASRPSVDDPVIVTDSADAL